jgi:hypothetical protein
MPKITIDCEGDPDAIRDAITIIEQMMPYMTDNVVVFTENTERVTTMKSYKLASHDPQVLVNNVIDQAVEAYLDYKGDPGGGKAARYNGFVDALAAILAFEEDDASLIIERVVEEL